MTLDILIEYTDAYCKAHPDILNRAWLTPTPAEDGVRGRFDIPYDERPIRGGRRQVTLSDPENGLVYSFTRDPMFNRHMDDRPDPLPNKIILTSTASGDVVQAWYETPTTDKKGMVNGLNRIQCTVFGWTERPASPADDARFRKPGADAIADTSEQNRKSEQARKNARRGAVVKRKDDRAKIRKAVNALIDRHDYSKREAWAQVADDAQKGHAGKAKLSKSYDMIPQVTTAGIVRRIMEADW